MAIKWPWLHFTQVYEKRQLRRFGAVFNNKLNCSWKLGPKVLQHNGNRKQMMWRCVNHVILLVQKSYPPMLVQDLIANSLETFPKKSHPPAWSAKAVSNLPKPIAFFLGLRIHHQIEESWTLHPANITKTKTSSYSSSSPSSSNNITKHYPSSYQPLKQRKKTCRMGDIVFATMSSLPYSSYLLLPEIQNHGKWADPKWLFYIVVIFIHVHDGGMRGIPSLTSIIFECQLPVHLNLLICVLDSLASRQVTCQSEDAWNRQVVDCFLNRNFGERALQKKVLTWSRIV